MALTQAQLDYVINLPVARIKEYIIKGDIKFPDDLIKYRQHPKFKEIQTQMRNMPDPAVLAQFSELSNLVDRNPDDPSLTVRLADFISRNRTNNTVSEQVARASEWLTKLTEQTEKADWDSVDHHSVNSLLAHRKRYPATSHENQIDREVWSLINKSRATDVRRYMAEFPSGLHYNECNAILEAQQLWQGVSTDPDLVTLYDYIEEEYDSPFIDDARQLYERLRMDELEAMSHNPGAYSADMVRMLLDMGIYGENELFDAKVVTPRVLELLANPPLLGDIEQKDVPEPDAGHDATDVFLFGIPSSGKTCVLTGLLGASEFMYDHSSVGGEYADQLKMYRDHGKAPGRTYGNFVARIGGRIVDGDDMRYSINLIEMSGEEFAMRIAYNKDREINFESMGTGATNILASNNPKVIFIVIDPSSTGLIRLATQRDDGSTVTRTVQQDIVINKIIDMLDKNPKVLKNTNAVHFIMTKADTIGPVSERDNVGADRLRTLYGHAITKLKEMGARYSFNTTSGGVPMLFTFSLGRFYVGDYYEYDPTDSDKIVSTLKSLVQSDRKRGFFDSIKSSIN